MRKTLATLTLIVVATLGVSAPAFAAVPSHNGSSVVDDANILSAEEEAGVVNQIDAIRTETGYDVAVLTVTSLNDQTIEEFALEVANTWGVGSADKNDGVLLVIAMDERKLRIEVGSGIHDILSDATAKDIVDNTITPQMKEANYAGAVSNGVAAIGDVFTGDIAPAPVTSTETSNSFDWVGYTVLVILLALVIIGLIIYGIITLKARKAEAAAKLAQEEAEQRRQDQLHKDWERRQAENRKRRAAEEEAERKRKAEHAAFLKTPEGKKAEAARIARVRVEKEQRRVEQEQRHARARVEAEKKKVADAETKKFYNSLPASTVSSIKRAKKSSRSRLLEAEIQKARRDGRLSSAVPDNSILNAIVLYSVFTASDSSYSSSSSSSRSSSSSSYSSGGGSSSSFDSGSSYSGGSFDGGGSSGGW